MITRTLERTSESMFLISLLKVPFEKTAFQIDAAAMMVLVN